MVVTRSAARALERINESRSMSPSPRMKRTRKIMSETASKPRRSVRRIKFVLKERQVPERQKAQKQQLKEREPDSEDDDADDESSPTYLPYKNYEFPKVSFEYVYNQVAKRQEGIVLLGCDNLEEWYNGVMDMFKDFDISPQDFYAPYYLETTGGRTDMVLQDKKGVCGKLAMWRLAFGGCSWMSDYVVNYAKQH